MHRQVLKLVFSNRKFIALSIVIFVGMLIPLSMFSGYIFLEPFWVFHVAETDVFSFSLLVIISILTGLVSSMGIYRIRILRMKSKKMSTGVIGSFIGAGAGACGCLSMSTTVISLFGTVGSTAAAFSTEYAVPLRLISIAILGVTFFTMVKGINANCKIQINDESN